MATSSLSPLTRRLVLGALTATLAFALGLTLARRPPALAAPSMREDILAEPAARPAASESPHEKPRCAEHVQVRLFFGLGTPDGPVSDVEWTRFLADVVTPRFPSGLTVVDANGQWRAHGHAHITREPSRVVEIVHDDSRETDRRIQEIVTIYKRQYRQESVMLTRGRIEVCF
jgi:Protein of unknown function (DUF3574)